MILKGEYEKFLHHKDTTDVNNLKTIDKSHNLKMNMALFINNQMLKLRTKEAPFHLMRL